FLGAGLFGMLFGGGLFSGIGGFSSILGLLLQIALIVFLVRMAMSWWQRRQMSQPAYADGGGGIGNASNANLGGRGFGLGTTSAPLQIEPADYEAFERILVEAQAAYSSEDGTRLLQGDLAEAWREGDTDYASVAMRFSMVDRYVDMNSGQLISGSEQPVE